jgi:AraC-like DNA-binding protein
MRELIEGLKRYAARDSRSRLTGDPRHVSLGAFVARKLERFAVLRLDRAVLMVLLEGRKELWQERLVHGAAAGEALVLPEAWQGEVVNLPDSRSGTYRCLAIGFPAALVRRAHLAHGDMMARPKHRGPAVTLTPQLAEAILHAASGLAAPDGLALRLLEHRVMEVLLALVEQGAFFTGLGEAGTAERVGQLVRTNPQHGWRAAEIAQALGASPATLRRRLAEEGTGLRGIIEAERMALAQILLSRREGNLAEIAAACGYASRTRFADRFEAATGCKPRQFAARAAAAE